MISRDTTNQQLLIPLKTTPTASRSKSPAFCWWRSPSPPGHQPQHDPGAQAQSDRHFLTFGVPLDFLNWEIITDSLWIYMINSDKWLISFRLRSQISWISLSFIRSTGSGLNSFGPSSTWGQRYNASKVLALRSIRKLPTSKASSFSSIRSVPVPVRQIPRIERQKNIKKKNIKCQLSTSIDQNHPKTSQPKRRIFRKLRAWELGSVHQMTFAMATP